MTNQQLFQGPVPWLMMLYGHAEFEYSWNGGKASLPIDSSKAAATAYEIASHPASDPPGANPSDDNISSQSTQDMGFSGGNEDSLPPATAGKAHIKAERVGAGGLKPLQGQEI